MAIEVGQEAPDFTLPDEQNQPVTLADFRGTPVVLVFYPFDFSPPCTAEFCEIRDEHGDWMEKGAKVFGISRDSRFVHSAFKESQNFKHTLLSDMKGEVARKYGTWNEDVGVANRLTVVIDREGKVAYTTSTDALPTTRDHSEVAAAIDRA